MTHTKAPLSSFRPLLFTAVLGLCLPRFARSEDSFAYKYEDYREGDGRMAIQTQSASLSQDLGTDTTIAFTGTNDAIAGATPTGVPAQGTSDLVPVTNIHDHRKAWSADVTQQMPWTTLDVGFAYSREHDYTSYGWSINTVTDFNQKNTELTLGVAGTEDDVEEFIVASGWTRKHGGNGIIGLTQLLSPNTSVSLDFTWGRETGFLADQYKEVAKAIQIFPGLFINELFHENRPNMRDHGTAVLGLNQAFPSLKGAIDASYRFYADTYGMVAHTVEVSWLQKFGEKFILQPNVRYYQQSAADFYYYNLNLTNVTPVSLPNGRGAFYSSDYRLSAEATYTFGAKAIWNLKPWLEFDLAWDKYYMRGTDGITPQSAYPRAKITTAGMKVTW